MLRLAKQKNHKETLVSRPFVHYFVFVWLEGILGFQLGPQDVLSS